LWETPLKCFEKRISVEVEEKLLGESIPSREEELHLRIPLFFKSYSLLIPESPPGEKIVGGDFFGSLSLEKMDSCY